MSLEWVDDGGLAMTTKYEEVVATLRSLRDPTRSSTASIVLVSWDDGVQRIVTMYLDPVEASWPKCVGGVRADFYEGKWTVPYIFLEPVALSEHKALATTIEMAANLWRERWPSEFPEAGPPPVVRSDP